MVASKSIEIRVGRSDNNDVTVPHHSVSSHHCTISFLDGQWFLEDSKSTNGTFINGVRVSQQALHDGDKVLLGLVGFRFVDGELELESTHLESTTALPADPKTGVPRNNARLSAILIVFALGSVAVVIAIMGRGTTPEQAEIGQSVGEKQNVLFTQPADLSMIIDGVRDSVVGVECGDSGGTGWALSTGDEELVVTNHHVVAECVGSFSPQIVVAGSSSAATIVSSDEYTDLAVLKINRPLTSLATASPPPIGSWLMVIGNPIGLDRSINYGTLTNNAEGFLITDAAINPGNSGGPVFNSRGEVIGVASAKLVIEGIDRIGLVIPLSDLCLQVLQCESGQWIQP